MASKWRKSPRSLLWFKQYFDVVAAAATSSFITLNIGLLLYDRREDKLNFVLRNIDNEQQDLWISPAESMLNSKLR
jgi:hypothetical protein